MVLCMQIRALTREELAEWWKLYVAALDKQLNALDAAACDTAPSPDAASQLATLQREALSLLTRCWPAAPASLLGLVPPQRTEPAGARPRSCAGRSAERASFAAAAAAPGHGSHCVSALL